MGVAVLPGLRLPPGSHNYIGHNYRGHNYIGRDYIPWESRFYQAHGPLQARVCGRHVLADAGMCGGDLERRT